MHTLYHMNFVLAADELLFMLVSILVPNVAKLHANLLVLWLHCYKRQRVHKNNIDEWDRQ